MPRLSYSIRRTPSGWQARYRDLEGVQRARNFKRRADAVTFLDSVRTDVRSGTYIDPAAGRERFESWAERWAAGRDWKETTRESFGPHLRRILPQLGRLRLDEIDKLELDRLRQRLIHEDGYAHSTATITMSYAKAMMRAAFETGLIARDPTVGVKPPRRRADDPTGEVGPEDVPTRAEVLAILTGAPAPYRAAIALGVAGLRVGEVLGVRADRLDLERRELVIDQQVQYVHSQVVITSPKREKVRTIVLPSAVVLELRRHLRDHQGAGILFRGRRGTPMMRRDQFYASAWKPALVAAGLEPDRFVFHSLRHFAASSMLANGGALPAVAGHLGDTVETISRTYAHWLRDDREVPADILDQLLAPHDGEADAL